MEILNPYHSDSDSLAPFAGRQAALMRLDHYLKESASSSALVFLSRRWQGKTALLRRFESTYDDAFVNVYLPLKHLSLASDDDLFQAILQGSGHSIAQRDITLTRLPAAESDQEDLRIWLDQTWLPAVAQVIRPHRKLVLLLDDADELLRAIDEERLPADSLAFLDQLMHQHPLLKLVFTFPVEREDDLTRFGALYSPGATLRLTNLALDESAWLLQSPPAGHYRVTDEAAQLVQQVTGGHPRFVQRFGFRIFENYEQRRDVATITPEIIKSLAPRVYQDSSAELDVFWRDSTDNEQLLLLTIGNLRHDDPLQNLTVDRLTKWLIDSEYPLDQTAVNAVLRGLEYRELVIQRSGGIELTCSLFQTWLLSHAEQNVASSELYVPRLRRLAILAIALLVLVTLLLLIALSNLPQQPGGVPPEPTVTLASGN